MVSESCIGKVENGKFIPENPTRFKAAFYGHEHKRVRVTVERFRKKRSSEQNGYYFGVIVPMIGDAIGEDDNQTVHDILKAKFNYEILVIGDEEIIKPKSTSKMPTSEFSDYVEKIRKWAAQFLSLYIPNPSEVI